jgi:co-chaperonin GroES (HSP10)
MTVVCERCKKPTPKYHPVRRPDGTTANVCPPCMGAIDSRPKPLLSLATNETTMTTTTDHTRIVPILDQILVRRVPEETVSTGGIIIPDAAHNPQLPRGRGIVLAVGPGRRRARTIDVPARIAIAGLASARGKEVLDAVLETFNSGDTLDAYEPLDVAVGDEIVFSKLSGDKLKDDLALIDIDDDLLLIRESEVIAVIESEGTDATP